MHDLVFWVVENVVEENEELDFYMTLLRCALDYVNESAHVLHHESQLEEVLSLQENQSKDLRETFTKQIINNMKIIQVS